MDGGLSLAWNRSQPNDCGEVLSLGGRACPVPAHLTGALAVAAHLASVAHNACSSFTGQNAHATIVVTWVGRARPSPAPLAASPALGRGDRGGPERFKSRPPPAIPECSSSPDSGRAIPSCTDR